MPPRTLQSTERELLDPGFRRLYQPPARPGDAPIIPAGAGRLAKLRPGERVKPRRVAIHKQPPPHLGMHEAELIRAMQTQGIGRPSTYAATVETLVARGYAVRHPSGELTSTARGQAVCQFLIDRFPGLFEPRYTARLEAMLDEIAHGQTSYADSLARFWQELQALLKAR